MKYAYWAFLGLLIVGGIGITVYFGLQPKSLPKIKPSQVASPERLGEAIAQRLWSEIKDSTVIFLGVDPSKTDDLRVWKGFLETLPKEKAEYSVIVIEPKIANKGLFPNAEEVDIKNDAERFKVGLKKALETKTRMAVIVPTIYSAQAIPENPINKIKEELQFQPVSLSLAEPTLNRDEEAQAVYPCATGSGDANGLGSWGCLVQSKSRGLYRKQWEPQKYIGLMDQIGASDYLVMLRFVK